MQGCAERFGHASRRSVYIHRTSAFSTFTSTRALSSSTTPPRPPWGDVGGGLPAIKGQR